MMQISQTTGKRNPAQQFLLLCLLIFFLTSSHAESFDDAADSGQRTGNGDPLAGRKKVQSENCRECHGANGISVSPSFPKLAGQYADYLVKQLQDFQSGARKHPVMSAMAEGLSEEDREDIAAYFASQPVLHGSSTTTVAAEIFMRGDMKRNIFPCQSCHGESGQGKFSLTGSRPRIGGQHRNYLREQLRNWRSGERHNSPEGVMNVIAKSLSDAEIEALTDYISGL